MSDLLHWRVRELASVTAEDLQRALNEAASAGWSLERVDYIKEAGVRRPQLAFCYFSRDAALGPPEPDTAGGPSVEEVVEAASGAWVGVYDSDPFSEDGAIELPDAGDAPGLELSEAPEPMGNE